MLLDTSGLLCCFDADDRRHQDAIAFYDAAPLRLTHNYVIAEFVALTGARRLPRAVSLEFSTAIATDPETEVVWVDATLHDEAMDWLKSQLDKGYSLCDAVSFVVMRDRKLAEALTTDRHFEQAGFRRLLPS
ncbi:MAG: PIN domain-containing protein [Candidatus Paceibacterota bacterium]